MRYADFNYEVDDGIGTVRLDNPDKLNAMSFQTYEGLERLTREWVDDDSVKVLVLTGTGKGFCTGGSVQDIIGALVNMDPESLYRFTRMSCNLIQNLRNLKKPIIAAVNGIAAGGGAMLALGCDLRILSDRAKFSFLFTKAGLAGSDMGALYLLPRIVGQGRAAELLFLGNTVDAQESYRIGLANRVVPHENLMPEVYDLARKLMDGPLYATGVTKELLNKEADLDMNAAFEMEAQAQAQCMQKSDFREAYQAFIEKRPPRFNQ